MQSKRELMENTTREIDKIAFRHFKVEIIILSVAISMGVCVCEQRRHIHIRSHHTMRNISKWMHAFQCRTLQCANIVDHIMGNANTSSVRQFLCHIYRPSRVIYGVPDSERSQLIKDKRRMHETHQFTFSFRCRPKRIEHREPMQCNGLHVFFINCRKSISPGATEQTPRTSITLKRIGSRITNSKSFGMPRNDQLDDEMSYQSHEHSHRIGIEAGLARQL